MCIYYSHVAKLPSEIFTFTLLDIGCSQPQPKKILSPVPLVRADTWNLLSAENKRLINTSSQLQGSGTVKGQELEDEERCSTGHDVATALMVPAQGQTRQNSRLCRWAVCSPRPAPYQKLLALDGC